MYEFGEIRHDYISGPAVEGISIYGSGLPSNQTVK